MRSTLSKTQLGLLLIIAFVLLTAALLLTFAITGPSQKSPDELYRESHLPSTPQQFP